MDNNNKILETLHSQFAENKNRKQGLFISLVTALIVFFGGFGYVYVHTATDSCSTCIKDGLFSNLILLEVAVVLLLVLLLLNAIILHLGYGYRRDQHLNKIIRINLLGQRKYEDIFGSLYNSDDKKYYNFLPDFYAIFWWFITIFQFCVLLAVLLKKPFNCCSLCNLVFIIMCIIFALSFVLFHNTWKKYSKLCNKDSCNNKNLKTSRCIGKRIKLCLRKLF